MGIKNTQVFFKAPDKVKRFEIFKPKMDNEMNSKVHTNSLRFKFQQIIFLWIHFLIMINISKAADSTPQLLQGKWEVRQVAVDLNNQARWRYKPNDPRLLGRIVEVGSEGKIEFSGRGGCEQVLWRAISSSKLSDLIAKSPRPSHFGIKKKPTIADFGLDLIDEKIIPYHITCTRPDQKSWGPVWFANLGNEKLIMGEDDLILILVKLNADTPIKASFGCNRAETLTEKAICSSFVLAGYDRSLALAFKRSLELRKEDKALIKEEQTKWLTERNKCNSDRVCLETKMDERVVELMQD